MEMQNEKPFYPQHSPFQIRMRRLLRIENILNMLYLHYTCSVATQRTRSSGISPGLCSMFTFSFKQFSSKRSFPGSGYKYQNSHCEENFKYSEIPLQSLS